MKSNKIEERKRNMGGKIFAIENQNPLIDLYILQLFN